MIVKMKTEMSFGMKKLGTKAVIITTYQTGTFDFSTCMRDKKPWKKGDKELILPANSPEEALKNHNKAMKKALKEKQEEYYLACQAAL